MKDRQGEIVYVGKAIDLRARLGQYFAPNPGDTRFFVSLLDQVLGDIEVIVARNGKEALLLENQLIKTHQPRFNVKLKDDKNFLSLRLARTKPWPRLEVVRRRTKDKADYFGPYHSASAIRNTLRVVNRHFQLRTCRDSEFRNRSRPCLEHQIGRCPAPCVGLADPAAYADNVSDVRLFLNGRSDDLRRRLTDKMNSAAEALEFELAARYRDQLIALRRSLTPQHILLNDQADVDAIGLYREGAELVVQVLTLRRGVLTQSRGFRMSKTGLPDDEVIDGFLSAYFDGTRPIPDQVILPVDISDVATWTELLTEVRGKRCFVKRPVRGDKRRLVELANENARTTFVQKQRARDDVMATLTRLQQRLALRNFPSRIECYDISNIQGADAVGSMVVATDGVMDKQSYRKFKIRGDDTPNDFAMLRDRHPFQGRRRHLEPGGPASGPKRFMDQVVETNSLRSAMALHPRPRHRHHLDHRHSHQC